jgi:RNA polymerase-binding transcription factor DksA
MLDQEAPALDADADAMLLLARRSEERLLDVDRALARVADGTYGYCTDCGSTIPLRRLRALPFTPVCVTCSNDRTDRGVASRSVNAFDEPDPLSSNRPGETGK